MDIVTLEPSKYDDFFKDWVIPALRSIVDLDCFEENDQWIADRMVPNVSPERVALAKEYLVSTGFLKRDETGKLRIASNGVTTAPEVKHSVQAVRNFHRQVLSLAEKALDGIDPKDRQISGLTVAASSECMMKIKKRIQEFQHQIFEMVCADSQSSQDVYQFNFQFFPVFRAEEPH